MTTIRDEVTREIAATPETVWSLVADVTRMTVSDSGVSVVGYGRVVDDPEATRNRRCEHRRAER